MAISKQTNARATTKLHSKQKQNKKSSKAAHLLVLAVQLVDNIGQGQRQSARIKQGAATLLRAAAANLKHNTPSAKWETNS
jgi:transcription termination factor Rho